MKQEKDMDLLLVNNLTGDWIPGASRWKKEQRRNKIIWRMKALFVFIVATILTAIINNRP